MSSDTTLELSSTSLGDTLRIGEEIGKHLRGGEVLDLSGDLGAGKTQLVRGIALGSGSDDNVQSPTFTVMREYYGERVTIYHYDFYRLNEPGIMRDEIREALLNLEGVVIVEWSRAVSDVMPADRIRVEIAVDPDDGRHLTFQGLPQHIAEALS